MRKVDDGKSGFWPGVGRGIGGMVGDAALSYMTLLPRPTHSERRGVASCAVTLVISRHRASVTHGGV